MVSRDIEFYKDMVDKAGNHIWSLELLQEILTAIKKDVSDDCLTEITKVVDEKPVWTDPDEMQEIVIAYLDCLDPEYLKAITAKTSIGNAKWNADRMFIVNLVNEKISKLDESLQELVSTNIEGNPKWDYQQMIQVLRAFDEGFYDEIEILIKTDRYGNPIWNHHQMSRINDAAEMRYNEKYIKIITTLNSDGTPVWNEHHMRAFSRAYESDIKAVWFKAITKLNSDGDAFYNDRQVNEIVDACDYDLDDDCFEKLTEIDIDGLPKWSSEHMEGIIECFRDNFSEEILNLITEVDNNDLPIYYNFQIASIIEAVKYDFLEEFLEVVDMIKDSGEPLFSEEELFIIQKAFIENFDKAAIAKLVSIENINQLKEFYYDHSKKLVDETAKLVEDSYLNKELIEKITFKNKYEDYLYGPGLMAQIKLAILEELPEECIELITEISEPDEMEIYDDFNDDEYDYYEEHEDYFINDDLLDDLVIDLNEGEPDLFDELLVSNDKDISIELNEDNKEFFDALIDNKDYDLKVDLDDNSVIETNVDEDSNSVDFGDMDQREETIPLRSPLNARGIRIAFKEKLSNDCIELIQETCFNWSDIEIIRELSKEYNDVKKVAQTMLEDYVRETEYDKIDVLILYINA